MIYMDAVLPLSAGLKGDEEGCVGARLDETPPSGLQKVARDRAIRGSGEAPEFTGVVRDS